MSVKRVHNDRYLPLKVCSRVHPKGHIMCSFHVSFFLSASYEKTATTVITTIVQVSSVLFTVVSISHEKHTRSTPSVKSVSNVDSENE